MSLGLYVDVPVPLSVTRGPRRRGVDVLTAQEDGTARLSDPEILRRALQLGRILFSQDEEAKGATSEDDTGQLIFL